MNTDRLLKCVRNEKGITMVLVALVIVLLVAFVGIGVDIGYMYVAKGQLQNAADAGALAGVGAMYPSNTSPPLSLPSPDWSSAQTSATAFVKSNKAGAAYLADGDIVSIQAGYWNLNQNPTGMQAQGIIPKGKCSTSGAVCTSNAGCTSPEECLMQDVPAVQVNVRKSGLPTFFARVVGWNAFSPAASAVAVTGAPGSVPAGGAFPFALTTCVINDYFSQNPLPNPPTLFTDTSVYHTKSGTNIAPGQWTDLTPNKSPSQSLLTDYINNMIDPTTKHAVPTPAVETGDPIMIDPGTKAATYHTTQDLIDAGKGLVLMPVVGTSSPGCTITPNTQMTITGFVAVKLISTTNSSMTGQFVGYYKNYPNAHPGGPVSNNVIQPVLVK